MSFIQKIFVTFEIPSSCPAGFIISLFTFLVIVSGVILFILSSEPNMNIQRNDCVNPVCNNDALLCPNKVICEPQPLEFFDQMDEVFIIYFTVDYGFRILTLWSAPAVLAGISKERYPAIDEFSFSNVCYKYYLYCTKSANLIDLASILPFYIQLGLGSTSSSSSSFVRVLRLARLLRVLKLGKNSATLDLLTKTMLQSMPALSIACFFIGLSVIVFASIFFLLESGTYKVTSEYPLGKYFRTTLAGDDEEVSPFKSIGHSIYYTIITMTTVGYGEFYCTSEQGRIVAAICCVCGILVLALPLSVIASNFTNNYKEYQEEVLNQNKQEQKKNVHNQRVDQLSIESLFENSVLYDEIREMEDPKFWKIHEGIHQKLEAIIEDQKQSTVNIRSRLNDLKDIKEYLVETIDANDSQHNNIKKVYDFGTEIASKLKLEHTYDVEDHHEKIMNYFKNAKKSTLFVPKIFTLITPDNHYTERKYELSIPARLFVCLEDQFCCDIASCIFAFMTLVILLGTVTFIMASTDEYMYTPSSCDNPVCDHDPDLCPNTIMCEPVSYSLFDDIDEFCVIVFTIEYLVRVFTLWAVPCRLAGLVGETWDNDEFDSCMVEDRFAKNIRKPRMDPPELDLTWKYFFYLTSPTNVIDFVAIVPFYISKANAGGSSSGSFVRVLRLVRLLRLLKLAKRNDQITVLYQTLHSSLPVLGILSLYVIIMAIIFGSVIYIIEQGNFKVTSENLNGAYYRPSMNGEEEVVTPFQSIAQGMYWALVTCTTLGYGDFYGTTAVGRFVTCICAICGIIVLALPISVVGNSFTTEYFASMERKKAKAKIAKEQQLKSSLLVNASPSISCDTFDTNDSEVIKNKDFEGNDDFFSNKIKGIQSEKLHSIFLIEKLQDLIIDLEADEKFICDQFEMIKTSALEVTHTCKDIKASHIARLQLLKSCIYNPHHRAIDPNILVGTSEENLYSLILNLEPLE